MTSTPTHRFGLVGLVGVLCLGTGACGGGSPNAPTPPTTSAPVPGGFVVNIDDPQGRLAAHHDEIRRLIDQTLVSASAALGIDGVTVSVTSDSARAIPGWGLGGYAPNAFTMDIALDPAFPNLGDLLDERLPPIVAHELHHNARWRNPGYGTTLLQNMISEGLADHFAVEHLDAAVPPWSRAFDASQTARWMDRARPELDSTTFNFDAWFFGTGSNLPRWTGYTLGYRLVEDYQAHNPGQSAAQLVHASAELFRPE